MSTQIKLDHPRSCACCRAELLRKRYGGRLEDRAVFLRRRFCDLRCMGVAKVTMEPALATVRKRTQKAVPLAEKCNRCPLTDNLQRHHINRDKTDNRPENIETLCAGCHATEHWATDKSSSPPRDSINDYLDGVEVPYALSATPSSRKYQKRLAA